MNDTRTTLTITWTDADYLLLECEQDAEMDAREDLCFHGIPKDERCPDCLDEAYDPDFGIDWGLPR